MLVEAGGSNVSSVFILLVLPYSTHSPALFTLKSSYANHHGACILKLKACFAYTFRTAVLTLMILL